VVKLLGARGASAVMGLCMLALGSSVGAQQLSTASVSGPATAASFVTGGTMTSPAAVLAQPAVASTTAIATTSGAVLQAQPAASVTMKIATSMATEASWLYGAGWPLYALVDRYSAGTPLDEEGNCLATAVYFEARGENVDGQMAVARVVMNRAASGRYPSTWCAVVKQPAQFSFVRHGQFPWIDTSSSAWARAQGVARVAMSNVVPSVSSDVLWYHADYVAPGWGRRLTIVQKIGAHIFYRG
jgi:N-acetylmuramoyl-L-alanine amidase